MHLAFLDMDFPAVKSRSFLWSWENVTKARQFLDAHKDSADRQRIETAFDGYDKLFEQLKLMRKGMPRNSPPSKVFNEKGPNHNSVIFFRFKDLLHGDLNERNVLVNSFGEVYAVLDFGDCQGGPMIWDVAVVMAYVCLALEDVERDLLELTGQALAGYCKHMPQVIQEHGSLDTLRVSPTVSGAG